MKKRLLVLFFIVLAFSSLCYAAEDVKREYTFKSIGKDFKYEKHQVINIDGARYKVNDIKYEVISKDTKKLVRDYTDLSKKEVPKTIEENGKKYKLAKTTYKEVKQDVKQSFRGTGDFEVPKSKEIEVGENKQFTGILKNVNTSLSDTFDTNFEVTGVFYGDEDVPEYDLNGYKIPASSAPTFTGYQSEVLRYLNLEQDRYILNSGSWSGGYYYTNGTTARNAIFRGVQKSTIYDATYEITKYDANSIYESSDADAIYKVKAIVSYKKVSLSIYEKIFIGIGILILAALAALILWIIAKRKKENKTVKVKEN